MPLISLTHYCILYFSLLSQKLHITRIATEPSHSLIESYWESFLSTATPVSWGIRWAEDISFSDGWPAERLLTCTALHASSYLLNDCTDRLSAWDTPCREALARVHELPRRMHCSFDRCWYWLITDTLLQPFRFAFLRLHFLSRISILLTGQ